MPIGEYLVVCNCTKRLAKFRELYNGKCNNIYLYVHSTEKLLHNRTTWFQVYFFYLRIQEYIHERWYTRHLTPPPPGEIPLKNLVWITFQPISRNTKIFPNYFFQILSSENVFKLFWKKFSTPSKINVPGKKISRVS